MHLPTAKNGASSRFLPSCRYWGSRETLAPRPSLHISAIVRQHPCPQSTSILHGGMKRIARPCQHVRLLLSRTQESGQGEAPICSLLPVSMRNAHTMIRDDATEHTRALILAVLRWSHPGCCMQQTAIRGTGVSPVLPCFCLLPAADWISDKRENPGRYGQIQPASACASGETPGQRSPLPGSTQMSQG